MRTAAVMVMRNESAYLRNCLTHLIANGIDFYIIDNASTDDSWDILTSPDISAHLIGVETYPYCGAFDWTGLMKAREAAARRLDADWVLFVSADEMMHSYRQGETLSAGIERIARTGADVIDFNEFVFLPVERDYPANAAGFPDLRFYYFYEPEKPRLMRARRAGIDISHVEQGGHRFVGAFRLAEESFALRHYMVRSQEHAQRKYLERTFRAEELAAGWHANRVGHARGAYAFPPRETLHRLCDPQSHTLDRSAPRAKHYWERQSAAA